MIHSQNMVKENTVVMTDCVMIRDAAPVACLIVCFNDVSAI